MPLFPTTVHVDLTGPDGNAFALMAIVANAMRLGDADESDVEQFRGDAMSGNYEHLVATCRKYVDFHEVGGSQERVECESMPDPADDEDDDYTVTLSPSAYRALCTLLLPGTHDIYAHPDVWDELQRVFPERDADVEKVAA